MNTYEANHGGPRRTRLWIVETLVVLGVIAFGYFAVTVDAARVAAPAPADTLDPRLELSR